MTGLWSWSSLAAVGVGAGSGVLSALAGVGGAVVSTPGIRALGATPLQAVGSTVPAIIPAAITGTLRYAREGLVDWRVGLTCGGVGAASSLVGAWASGRVEGGLLMVLTALLVLWSSVSVLRRPSAPRPDATDAGEPERDRSTGTAGIVAMGLGAGFVAGFLGVGGGIVLVPMFRSLLGLPVKRTIATSLVAVALMSSASLAGHVAEGHVAWTYALPLMVGVVPGARVGSRIAIALPEHQMRLVCGGLLLVLGAAYLASELAALA